MPEIKLTLDGASAPQTPEIKTEPQVGGPEIIHLPVKEQLEKPEKKNTTAQFLN